MINCYPVWTAAAPIVRHVTHHIGHRIVRHGFRRAALATVRIVCVAVPAWLASPAPAIAPAIPAPETTVLPPAMLPWPGDGAPWGWGVDDVRGYGGMPALRPAYTPGADMPALPPSDAPGADMPAWTLPVQVVDIAPPDASHQPIPAPPGAAVMLVGIAALLMLRVRQ